MGFAAGFFGTLAKDIDDRQEYIRKRVEEQSDYIRKIGLARQAEVAATRNQLQTAAEGLANIEGMDPQRVKYWLENDPEKVITAHNAYYNGDMSLTKLQTMFTLDENYNQDATFDELVRQVTPAFVNLPDDADPASLERVGLAAMLGLDVDYALQQEVYNAKSVYGATGNEVEASINAPFFQSTRSDLRYNEGAWMGGKSEYEIGALRDDAAAMFKDRLSAWARSQADEGDIMAGREFADKDSLGVLKYVLENRDQLLEDGVITQEDLGMLAGMYQQTPEILRTASQELINRLDPEYKSGEEEAAPGGNWPEFEDVAAVEEWAKNNPEAATTTEFIRIAGVQVPNPAYGQEIEEETPEDSEAMESAGLASTPEEETGLREDLRTWENDNRINRVRSVVLDRLKQGEYGRIAGFRDAPLVEYAIGARADAENASELRQAHGFILREHDLISRAVLREPDLLLLLDSDPVAFWKHLTNQETADLSNIKESGFEYPLDDEEGEEDGRRVPGGAIVQALKNAISGEGPTDPFVVMEQARNK